MMPRFRRQLANLLSSSCSTDLSRNYSLFQFFAYGQRSEARACIGLQNVRGFDEYEVKDRTPRRVDSLAFRPIPEAWPGRPQNRWLCTSTRYALSRMRRIVTRANAQKRPRLITRHTSLAVCF